MNKVLFIKVLSCVLGPSFWQTIATSSSHMHMNEIRIPSFFHAFSFPPPFNQTLLVPLSPFCATHLFPIVRPLSSRIQILIR